MSRLVGYRVLLQACIRSVCSVMYVLFPNQRHNSRWRADNDTYEARLQASVKSNLLYYYHELTWLSALRSIGSSPNHVRDTLPLIRFPLI
jgi:hypothetical protein